MPHQNFARRPTLRTTRLGKQKMSAYTSYKSKQILGKNYFNMHEQYCEIKYLVPLNIFFLFHTKKNIENN